MVIYKSQTCNWLTDQTCNWLTDRQAGRQAGKQANDSCMSDPSVSCMSDLSLGSFLFLCFLVQLFLTDYESCPLEVPGLFCLFVCFLACVGGWGGDSLRINYPFPEIAPWYVVCLHSIQNTGTIMASDDVNVPPVSHCANASSSCWHGSLASPPLEN